MFQPVKELATKPDNLKWITGTHMVKGQNQFSCPLIIKLHGMYTLCP